MTVIQQSLAATFDLKLFEEFIKTKDVLQTL